MAEAQVLGRGPLSPSPRDGHGPPGRCRWLPGSTLRPRSRGAGGNGWPAPPPREGFWTAYPRYPRAIAATLSQALITGARDRVLGEFADVYQQVGSLLRWIGRRAVRSSMIDSCTRAGHETIASVTAASVLQRTRARVRQLRDRQQNLDANENLTVCARIE